MTIEELLFKFNYYYYFFTVICLFQPSKWFGLRIANSGSSGGDACTTCSTTDCPVLNRWVWCINWSTINRSNKRGRSQTLSRPNYCVYGNAVQNKIIHYFLMLKKRHFSTWWNLCEHVFKQSSEINNK